MAPVNLLACWLLFIPSGWGVVGWSRGCGTCPWLLGFLLEASIPCTVWCGPVSALIPLRQRVCGPEKTVAHSFLACPWCFAYAKAAVATIGIQNDTFGCFSHALQVSVLMLSLSPMTSGYINQSLTHACTSHAELQDPQRERERESRLITLGPAHQAFGPPFQSERVCLHPCC